MLKCEKELQVFLPKYKTLRAWRKYKVILTGFAGLLIRTTSTYFNLSMFYLDRESAEKLAKVVESACVLLADYNGRLSAELEDRTTVCKMLRAYLSSQKKKVSECDQQIEVWRK